MDGSLVFARLRRCDPHLIGPYMLPWAHSSPHPERHLDRFNRFAGFTILTDRPTDHATQTVAIGYIYRLKEGRRLSRPRHCSIRVCSPCPRHIAVIKSTARGRIRTWVSHTAVMHVTTRPPRPADAVRNVTTHGWVSVPDS